MFRIVCDPSSGSTELCLTEITLSGSQIFFVCLVDVWQRNFELAVCVCVCLCVCVHGTMGRTASALNRHTVRLFTEIDDTRRCNNPICPPEDEQGTARNMLPSTQAVH